MSTGSKTGRRLVLIVDDEELIANAIHYGLKSEYDVETASDGRSCLEKMPNYKPDVVVLDLMLPIVGGYEVLKEIKKHPDEDVRDARVIVITRYGTIDNAVACMKAGAEDFIQIPFDVDRLREAIRTALED